MIKIWLKIWLVSFKFATATKFPPLKNSLLLLNINCPSYPEILEDFPVP